MKQSGDIPARAATARMRRRDCCTARSVQPRISAIARLECTPAIRSCSVARSPDPRSRSRCMGRSHVSASWAGAHSTHCAASTASASSLGARATRRTSSIVSRWATVSDHTQMRAQGSRGPLRVEKKTVGTRGTRPPPRCRAPSTHTERAAAGAARGRVATESAQNRRADLTVPSFFFSSVDFVIVPRALEQGRRQRPGGGAANGANAALRTHG